MRNSKKRYTKNNKKVIKGGSLSDWSNRIITLIRETGITIEISNSNSNSYIERLNGLQSSQLYIKSVGLKKICHFQVMMGVVL